MSQDQDLKTLLQDALIQLRERRRELDEVTRAQREPIAIIGMSCRFPGGADSPEAFWRLLADGVDAVTEVPPSRWDLRDWYDAEKDRAGKSYSRHGAFLENVDQFDAEFFQIAAREAEGLDPQQRLLLEVAWEAIERACVPADQLKDSRTGVYVGICNCDYRDLYEPKQHPERLDAYFGTGTAFSVAAGRLSYFLGLQGPSLAIDTACSSSLVALHLACHSLRRGECAQALAGGVNLILSPSASVAFSRAQMLAADGHCKTFDAAADGYVRGEGCGIVVLKRLCDAIAAGDQVLAVIRGSAINQDGRSGGLTAPNGPSQETLIRQALSEAGCRADEIDYVEAHGTGTSLGDPIEALALGQALSDRQQPVWVGSVKTNIGHLEAAAGIAGLIKVILAMQQETIPPNLHFHEPSPYVPWDRLPLQVPTQPAPWRRSERPRRAGISSFGFAGTNAHLILEEAPAVPCPVQPAESQPYLLPLSARSETALRQLADRYTQYLQQNRSVSLRDLCATASRGRTHLPYRCAVVAASPEQINLSETSIAEALSPPRIAMLCFGSGPLNRNGTRELYSEAPEFRAAWDRCSNAFQQAGAAPLSSLLDDDSRFGTPIAQQQIRFALQIGLAELWSKAGIHADVVLGFGTGEIAACCIAAGLSLEEACRLVILAAKWQGCRENGDSTAAVQAEWRTACRSLPCRPFEIPVVSGVTGRFWDDHRFNGTSWTDLLSQPDHATAAMKTLGDADCQGWIVLGAEPGEALSSSIAKAVFRIPSLESECEPRRAFLEGLAELYRRGAELAWDTINAHPRQPGLALPTYPFQRRRYWLTADHVEQPESKLLVDVRWEKLDSHGWASPPSTLSVLNHDAFSRLPSAIPGERSLPASLNPETYRRLEQIGQQWIVRALGELGGNLPPGEWQDASDLQQLWRIPEPRSRLLGRCLKVLEKLGILASQNGGWRILQPLPQVDPAAAIAALQETAPELEAETVLLARCGASLASVLRGECDPLELLFPGGSSTDVEKLYQQAPLARLSNEVIAEVLRSLVNSLPEGTRLRVLEVGAGTGSTTSFLLPQLKNTRFEYHFTDLTPVFLERGREKFAAWPELHYELLDIEQPGAAQGFAGKSFDIIIASNVVHATSDIRRSLQHLRELLAENGLLLLFETTAPQVWVDLIFGLTDGWWKFRDQRLRPEHPLLSAASWSQVLQEEQFGEVFRQEVLDFGPRPTVSIARRVPDSTAERWIVFRGRSEFARNVVDRLQAECESLTTIIIDDRWDEEDYRAVFSGQRYQRILDLTSLDAQLEHGSAEDLRNQHRRIAGRLLPLIQTLSKTAGSPRLWIATRGCHQVAGIGDESALPQAHSWGLGRVAAQEYPQLLGGLIDLDPAETVDESAAQLLQVILAAPPPHDELAIRQQEFYQLRLSPMPAHSLDRPSFKVTPQGSVLITGGLGGLGMETARWMIGRGAKSLILLGRTDPSPSAAQQIRQWEQQGIRIEVAQADVASERDLQVLFERLKGRGVTLTGIVHSAGSYDDRLLAGQTAERFVSALEAKAIGAWNLHRLTRSMPLDFFILYSSAAAFFAPPGAGSYCAANTFVDALAAHRRTQGLPALSIDWGPWNRVGMADAVGRDRETWWAISGISTMSNAEALTGMESLLASETANAGVVKADWAQYANRFAPGSLPGRFDDLVPAAVSSPAAQDAADDPLARLPIPQRRQALHETVSELVAKTLRMPSGATPHPEQPFREMGLDSLMAVELTKGLGRELGRSFPATLLFEYPTVRALTDHVAAEFETSISVVGTVGGSTTASAGDAVAIVGMACRFPGGIDEPAQFWKQLLSGRDTVMSVPESRWNWRDYFDADPEAPERKLYTRHGSFLDAVDEFDAGFFGISPREATSMDPQQRMLLEIAWHAFEHAGLSAAALAGSRTGVFIGLAGNDFARLLEDPAYLDAYRSTGNAPSMAAGRLAYLLGLQGPGLVVDTACSSSLVAVHLASRALLDGECDFALAGGVNLMLTPDSTIAMCKMSMLARDGRCKTFDAAADGFGRGEGCGLIVLKRLSDAERDGDRILAVVRGSAVNQDGRSSSLTAPSGTAQEAVMRQALRSAGVEPADVRFVECHGTGTSLGDPIEVRSVAKVYGADRAEPLILGAVKANLGHLEAAAGIAGLIKAVLVLEHATVPPQPNLETPNPHISWNELPVTIPTASMPLSRRETPLIAGVSSFGFSGTNAHVVLEAGRPRTRTASPAASEPALVLLSARNPEARDGLRNSYADRLTDDVALQDFAFTLQTARAHHPYRFAAITDSTAKARQLLSGGDLFRNGSQQCVFLGDATTGNPPTVGIWYGDFEDSLLPVLAEGLQKLPAVQKSSEALLRLPQDSPNAAIARWLIHHLTVTEIWRSFGVVPAMVGGEGTGRLIAACTAGLLSVDEAIQHILRPSDRRSFAETRGSLCGLFDGETGRLFESGERYHWMTSSDNAAAIGEGPASRPAGCTHLLVSGQTRTGIGLPMLQHDGRPALATLATLYVSGADFHWPSLGQFFGGQRITLPGYPFQRRRYWPIKPVASERNERPASISSAKHHPLLGGRLISPAITEPIFQNVLCTTAAPFIADHRLFGTAVLPATAYLETALAAAGEIGKLTAVAIENLQIHQPLLIGDDEQRLVQTLLNRDGDGWLFKIVSLPSVADDGGWITHATGRISAGSSQPEFEPALPPPVGMSVSDGTDYYKMAAAAGFEFGPRFRGLARILSRDGQSIGEVQFPADLAVELPQFRFHPGLMDACFQVLGAALPEARQGEAYMPLGLQRFELFARPPAELRSTACLRAQTGDYETVLLDVRIETTAGQLIARVEGLHFKHVRREALRHDSARIETPSTANRRPLPDLKQASPARREQLLVRYVSETLKDLLELPSDAEIDPAQSLSELGMDSFSAIELTGELSRGTGFELPSTLVYAHPNVQAIAQELLTLLAPATSETPAEDEPDPTLQQALQEIENLSPEDLDAELEKILLALPERDQQ